MRISNRFAIVSLLLHSLSAHAGLGTFDGESEETWTRDRFSVIVATISDVQPAHPESLGTLTITLLPKATIGGAFDCGAEPRIVATCWYAIGGNSALSDRPQKGMLVLALICRDEIDPRLTIPNYICPLMSNKEPLCVIKGLDDPEVAKTLERIQKARAIAKKKEAEESAERRKHP